jgi:hypothetical protein
MAQASITVNTDASINGRLMAMTGAVTLQSNDISMFIATTLALYTVNTFFSLGTIIFDCATNTFQEVIVAGTSGPTKPNFNTAIGGTTQDGTITWQTLDPPIGAFVGLPPSPPNTPPLPPTAPTGLRITSEQ